MTKILIKFIEVNRTKIGVDILDRWPYEQNFCIEHEQMKRCSFTVLMDFLIFRIKQCIFINFNKETNVISIFTAQKYSGQFPLSYVRLFTKSFKNELNKEVNYFSFAFFNLRCQISTEERAFRKLQKVEKFQFYRLTL